MKIKPFKFINVQVRGFIRVTRNVYREFSKNKIAARKQLPSKTKPLSASKKNDSTVPEKKVSNSESKPTPPDIKIIPANQVLPEVRNIKPPGEEISSKTNIDSADNKIPVITNIHQVQQSVSTGNNNSSEPEKSTDDPTPVDETEMYNDTYPVEEAFLAADLMGNKPVKETETTSWPADHINSIEQKTSTNYTMNTTNGEPQTETIHAPVEFEYLKTLIDYRLNNFEGNNIPEMPNIEEWNLPVKKFIKDSHLEKNQAAATLLLIGLAPHADGELFDHAIQEKLKTSGDFPEIGGVRGKNFRGFLPTGQTAVFLLAGNNLQKQKEVEQLFWSDKDFAKKKILWLEELPQGDPVMSGKITMALDYIDMFLFGAAAPPHFSTSFPAKKITTKLTSNDIVMNDEVKKHYKNLKDWLENNPELLRNWDKQERLKKGFRALFYGPPGTGKTLTANVLGNETGKDVYKIDLSMVVSKYIGETEKNLELLFARAEDKDWILFFDEADAIFGKRTDVRDAHDKYANQEVSYLLQRIEDFNGLVILTTNRKNDIDNAFIRRFNDIVKFTVPDENERKEIWEQSFPEESDFENIPNQVKKYELTGGNIINVIHFASIQAVKKRNEPTPEKNAPINGNIQLPIIPENKTKLKFYLEDVVAGIRREMIKEGKPFGI